MFLVARCSNRPTGGLQVTTQNEAGILLGTKSQPAPLWNGDWEDVVCVICRPFCDISTLL